MTIVQGDWPQLLSLMDQALDLPAPERRAWVQGLGLPASLAQALQGLVDARGPIETDDFLGGLPPGIAAPARTLPGRLQPGGVVGPWRLLREVGQGGMSAVWLAERADDQGQRQVALKVPHAGPGQDVLARRLLRERDILAGLEHPHIARLYDVGLTDAGTPYMVMEYVPGETLVAHADARRLGVAPRVALFQQVLAAVQYAHARLVLHRDLKPGNILVTADGGVKLLDFGIAKLMGHDGQAPQATELTRAAGRPLTPEYASPEQLLGQPLGTASDVYSLGVVLYELLCGQRPHALQGLTPARREEALLHQEPKAPSRQPVGAAVLAARATSAPDLRRALAGDIDAIVLNALARSPAQRYASVEAFGKDVARWLAGKPVSARVPSAWYYLGKFVQRHRWGVGLGVVAGSALVAAGATAVWQGVQAQREAAKAVAVRNFMVDVFRDVDPELIQGREPTGRELLRRSRDRLMAAAGTGAGADLPVGDLLQGLADAQAQLGDDTGADETLALLLQRLPLSADPSQRLHALLARAELALTQRDMDAARSFLDAAARLHRAVPGPRRDARQLARMQGQLALHDADLPAARAHLQRYVDTAPQPDDDRPLNVLIARLALAKAASMAGDDAGAAAHLASATRYADGHTDELFGAQFHQLATFRANLAVAAGQYASLQAWLPETIRQCDRVLGERSRACRNLKDQWVRALLKMGRYDQVAEFTPALQAWSAGVEGAALQAQAAVSLARAYAYAGPAQALPELEGTLARVAAALPPVLLGGSDGEAADAARAAALPASAAPAPAPAPADVGGLQVFYRLAALNTLAETRLLAGQPEPARAWLARARALDAARPEPASAAERRKTALFEGIALQLQGQHAAALQAMGSYCDEAAVARERLQVLTRYFSLNCAPSLAATGRQADAVALIRRALPVLTRGYGEDAPSVARAHRLLRQIAGQPGAAASEPATDRPEPAFFS